MMTTWSVQEKILLSLKDSALFYPCSGNDLDVPISLFSPFVTDFWFVDRGYFSTGNQDTKHYGFDLPANKQARLLWGDRNYRLIGKPVVTGLPDWDRYNREIEPCVKTETYLHVASKREIRIHRYRRYGFSALHNEINSLGVFFYRGDSEGEGGSGNLWLAPEHINEVCDKLIDGGIIVTDGSQHGRSNYGEYEGFWKYRYLPMEGDELMNCAETFTDSAGRTFTCVGYAGKRYGHTLIWQVKK